MKSAVRKKTIKEKNHPCETRIKPKRPSADQRRATKMDQGMNPIFMISEENLTRLRIPYECLFNW